MSKYKKKKEVTNYLGPSDLKFCDAMKFYIQFSFNTAHFYMAIYSAQTQLCEPGDSYRKSVRKNSL